MYRGGADGGGTSAILNTFYSLLGNLLASPFIYFIIAS
jgi:hypothetical protein